MLQAQPWPCSDLWTTNGRLCARPRRLFRDHRQSCRHDHSPTSSIVFYAARSLLPVLTGLVSALLLVSITTTRLLSALSACFRSALRVVGKIAGRHLPALFACLRGALLIVCKVAAGIGRRG